MFCKIHNPRDGSKVIGWIETRNGLHTYHAYLRSDEIDPATLALDGHLQQIIAPYASKKWFTDKLCGTADSFARNFQKLISELSDQKDGESGGSTSSNTWSRIELIVEQLDAIGWNRVVSINAELTLIKLSMNDESGRQHLFDVSIPANYPSSPPSIQASLPLPVTVIWPERGNSGDLSLIINIMRDELIRHEKMFFILEDIDVHCWVLEPIVPTFAITSRRIVIEKTCSVIVDIKLDDPYGICEIRFLGAPHCVLPLQAHLGQNIHFWDRSLTIRNNLEVVLGIKLPLKSQSSREENYRLECGICYSYTLTNDAAACEGLLIPDQVCPNPKCGRVYHSTCLIHWLQSVPSSRTSFGTTFGACPYCNEALSTKSAFV